MVTKMMNPRYREVLVAYDVEDNKTRTRMFNQLKDIGLISIQKSVMWGRLLPAEIKLVQRLLLHELDQGSDKAFIHQSRFKEKAQIYGDLPQLGEYDELPIF